MTSPKILYSIYIYSIIINMEFALSSGLTGVFLVSTFSGLKAAQDNKNNLIIIKNHFLNIFKYLI